MDYGSLLTYEQKMREYLSKIPKNDIDNSKHFYDVDFMSDDIHEIVACIVALYEDVNKLDRIIKSDFKSNEARAYMHNFPVGQIDIKQDYNLKAYALSLITANEYCTQALIEAIADKEMENVSVVGL